MYFLQSTPCAIEAGFMIVTMVILAVQLLVIVLTCSVACGMVCYCRKRQIKGQSQKGKQSPPYNYIHTCAIQLSGKHNMYKFYLLAMYLNWWFLNS